MKTNRIAFVPFGANHRVFAIVKEDNAMPLHPGVTVEAIEKAHALLGELIPVFKSDVQMDIDATQAVAAKLDAAAELIMPPVDPAQPASGTLSEIVSGLRKQLESLSGQATATDFAFGDQVDTALESVGQVEAMVQKMEIAPVVPITEPAVASAATIDAAAAAPEIPAVAPAATMPGATPEVAAAVPVIPVVEPVVAAAPVEPPGPAAAATMTGDEAATAAAAPGAPTATPAAPDKSDGMSREEVQAVMKATMAEVLAPLKAQIEQLTVAKSAPMPVTPATSQAATLRAPAAPKEAAVFQDDWMENQDLTLSPDLKHIDAYGRITK